MAAWNTIGNIPAARAHAGWQPKESRIRVGTDAAPVTSTGFCGKPSRNFVLGEGDDVALTSKGLFSHAKAAAQQGGRVESFRGLAKRLDAAEKLGNGAQAASANTAGTIYQKGDYRVDYTSAGAGGELTIRKKNAETGEYEVTQSISTGEDVRIAWDKDGNPNVLTGAAALTDGVLAAKGDGEILLRASKADVKAGDNTVVVNTSSFAGTYRGGGNVTYLGNYQGGTFTDTTGDATFAGYFTDAAFNTLGGKSTFSGVFEASSIEMGEGGGTCSGYFSASKVAAGKTGIVADGLFVDGCTVRGGDGDDVFSGRFIAGSVEGGNGNDSFGNAASASRREKLTYSSNGKTDSYQGIAADFTDVRISMGAGNDAFTGVMWGGTLAMEQGNNTVEGVFGKAAVTGGMGDDEISAVYSYASSFTTGDGKNTVDLKTAVSSDVVAEGGKNEIFLGGNKNTPSDATWQTRDDFLAKARPTETGEAANNSVDAKKGDNTVAVHNGESVVTTVSGDERVKNAREERQFSGKALSERTPEHTQHLEMPADLSGLVRQPVTMHNDTASALRAASLPKNADGENASTPQNIPAHRLVKRYAKASDASSAVAATVTTAPGESLTVHGAARHNSFEEQEAPGMVRLVRRANMNGGYAMKRWLRLVEAPSV